MTLFPAGVPRLQPCLRYHNNIEGNRTKNTENESECPVAEMT